MASGDFLAKIKLALEGKDKVVSGLQQTQQAAQQLAKTKITTIFDKEGLATGRQVEETFTKIKPAVKDSFQNMNDFQKALARVAVVAPVWMAFRFVLQSVFSLIADQTKFLIDLENAMARIRIVGKGTEDDYKKLQSSLIGLSLAYGTVASSALEAAKIFAQQGRTIDQTITLTRIAMIASQVLGTDMKIAVDDLTAAIESFNLPIEDSISIIDKWINVEKQFAVTSKDLADATKAAGATANQMGITIDEFLGNVTAVIEVTRKSGSEAARGLQFIYARLLTTGEQVLTQIAKVPIHLDKQKKATFAMTDTYRSASDVLDDLASRWDTLTNKERLSIAQNVASKRQLTIFMALMQNYNAALEARIISLSSAGKAEEAFSIIQETLTIKLNRVATAWNNLTISIGDTSVFKEILDVTSELIKRWAAIINISQAYRNEAQNVKDTNKKIAETQISQAKSLQELIELRDKYINLPATESNVKMLTRINQALEEVKSRSKINVDINSKDATANLNKFIDTISKTSMQQEIDIDIETSRTILQDKINKLSNDINITPLDLFISPFAAIRRVLTLKKHTKELGEVQEELKKLDETRNKKLDERIAAYETEKTQLEAQSELRKYDNEIETELTDKEIEKFQMQSKLNALRQSGILTNQQILDIEIEMVKNSIFSYDIHEKALKLAELESQKESAILSDIKTKIGYMSDALKIADEEESAIIRQEMAMKAMIYGTDYIRNSMDDRLKLAQALTKEADVQEKKSARLVELFNIARRYGKDVAQEVSNFLGGMKEFSTLSPGAIRALRRVMPSEFEKGRAEEYFKQPGAYIRFPEEIEKERIRRRDVRILQNIMVEPISIDVRLESEQVIDSVVAKITELLNDKKSILSQQIQEQIETF